MGWDDFYQRNAALDTVLTREDRPLRVPDGFTDLDEVLLALQHRWSLRLAGRLELATLAAERDPDVDPVDAVVAAWRETAETDPDLRRVLDANADRPALRAALRTEQRMLARAAGLAEAGDGPDEQSAVGAALLALVRTGERPATRRNPVERLLARLVPSA